MRPSNTAQIFISDLDGPLAAKIINLTNEIERLRRINVHLEDFPVVYLGAVPGKRGVHWIIVNVKGDILEVVDRHANYETTSKGMIIYTAPCWMFYDQYSWEILDSLLGKTHEEIFNVSSYEPTPLIDKNATLAEAHFVRGDDEWEIMIGEERYVITKIKPPSGTPAGETWFMQYNKRVTTRKRLVVRFSDCREAKKTIVIDEIYEQIDGNPNLEGLFKPLLIDLSARNLQKEKANQELKIYDAESEEGVYKSLKYKAALDQEIAFKGEYGYLTPEEWEYLFGMVRENMGENEEKFEIVLK